MFREEHWVMSKEDLARFKSDKAKLLALQHRKVVLDKLAFDLDDNQAGQPAGEKSCGAATGAAAIASSAAPWPVPYPDQTSYTASSFCMNVSTSLSYPGASCSSHSSCCMASSGQTCSFWQV